MPDDSRLIPFFLSALIFVAYESATIAASTGALALVAAVTLASEHVERAGLLYSLSLRFFLMVAPLVTSIVSSQAMPPMTLALIAVLWRFDRPPRLPLPLPTGVERAP